MPPPDRPTRTLRRLPLPAALLLLPLLGGCLQLDVLVQLQPDGAAVVTERLRLSRELLDLDTRASAGLRVRPLLEKAAFLERAKHMGKGVRLLSHQLRDAEKGAREAVAVFRIDDLRELKYVSPFLSLSDYPKRSVIEFGMFELTQDTWYGRQAGQLAVTVKPVGREPRGGKKEEPPKGPSPRELQVLRDLRPVFRDLLKDFRLKLTFESYAPLRFRQYYRYRGMRAGTKRFDLLDFADDDLDNYGYAFLDNEEVMLELLRGQLDGPNVLEHVKAHGTNLTLPVFHPGGVPEIYFRPSRQLFDKLFLDKAGRPKTLTFDPRSGPPRKADFAKDGWRGDPPPAKAPGKSEKPKAKP